MAIDLKLATQILKEEAERADSQDIDPKWRRCVERISELAEKGGTRTHVAFLGTAMLAKATDLTVDVFAVKKDRNKPTTYSARTLAHSVLVPQAAALGFNLGVNGREPLNNQPYFRMKRLDDGTPIHANAREVFDEVVKVVSKLSTVKSKRAARQALRSFIFVRRQYQPKYEPLIGEYQADARDLIGIIDAFVSEDSEGGRRAQAVAAGLLELFAGEGRVLMGRINDPSRHFPGDIAIQADDGNGYEKSFEVRDKPVTVTDAQIFGQQCLAREVYDAAVIAVARTQPSIETDELDKWANALGLGLTIFHGWSAFVGQALFWAPIPTKTAASQTIPLIYARLVEVETSEKGVQRWLELVQPLQVISSNDAVA